MNKAPDPETKNPRLPDSLPGLGAMVVDAVQSTRPLSLYALRAAFTTNLVGSTMALFRDISSPVPDARDIEGATSGVEDRRL
jgi:hypothetical protein